MKNIDESYTKKLKPLTNNIETSQGNIGDHYLEIAQIMQNKNINTHEVNGTKLNLFQTLYKAIEYGTQDHETFMNIVNNNPANKVLLEIKLLAELPDLLDKKVTNKAFNENKIDLYNKIANKITQSFKDNKESNNKENNIYNIYGSFLNNYQSPDIDTLCTEFVKMCKNNQNITFEFSNSDQNNKPDQNHNLDQINTGNFFTKMFNCCIKRNKREDNISLLSNIQSNNTISLTISNGNIILEYMNKEYKLDFSTKDNPKKITCKENTYQAKENTYQENEALKNFKNFMANYFAVQQQSEISK